MRIAILTSSRADFGIYLPLLRKLVKDNYFSADIIAFGTHLSPFHGETVKVIEAYGFTVKARIHSMLLSDTPEAIATATALTMQKFADFWQQHTGEYDLVLCLGDRYEMFAAVMATIPFGVKVAHLHGGETTLGAIDNIFRDAITLASKVHFASTEKHAKRIAEILGRDQGIYFVGALSLDNLLDISFISVEDFAKKWGVDLSKKTILVTFHPETVNFEKNEQYTKELVAAIRELTGYQFLITMPNADTSGNSVRKILTEELGNQPGVYMVENLGTEGYFSAMKHAALLLGNTSSGIIEAASLGKYVIDLGDRQAGRTCSENILNIPVKKEVISTTVREVAEKGEYKGSNVYHNSGAADKIIQILKQISA